MISGFGTPSPVLKVQFQKEGRKEGGKKGREERQREREKEIKRKRRKRKEEGREERKKRKDKIASYFGAKISLPTDNSNIPAYLKSSP